MRVNWAVASDYKIDPAINLDQIKSIGPVWGSYKTWRSCSTDNVICHEASKARELLDRAFQAVCNFYVPRSQYEFLQRPLGVKLYEGDFKEEVDNIEDIVTLHLVGAVSDIVLLLGYDLGTPQTTDDRLKKHKILNRHGLLHGVINNLPKVQWVVVDPPGDLDKAYKNLPNVTCDTMSNALQLLT